MKLGGAFPPDVRRACLDRSLRPGAILYLFCPFTNPAKDKYCILACRNPGPVVFLVNSKISQWLQARPPLRDCQVILHKRDHPFLRHDSYVDCTQAHWDLSWDEIMQQLMEDPSRLKGEVTAKEREAIVYAVQAGRTIETRVKQDILVALNA